MQKLIVLCFILLFSLIFIATTPSEGRSIRLTTEFFKNPNLDIYETNIPFEFDQEQELMLDNMPRKTFSKRYARIGGTIVMGK
uniref:Uncharacterized protein n=1 Tax=Panagrolaimus sp. PS1159 TaxID=55785 RepID=A0AC35ERV0_9BILA